MDARNPLLAGHDNYVGARVILIVSHYNDGSGIECTVPVAEWPGLVFNKLLWSIRCMPLISGILQLHDNYALKKARTT